MRIFITGGTGLIGRCLTHRLIERGDRPVILTRNVERARSVEGLSGCEFVQGDPGTPGAWSSGLGGCQAVVNLVGHNLFHNRWSEEVKRKIRASRVDSTANLVAAIEGQSPRPDVLVEGSAVGYYGACGDEVLDEAAPPGSDFLAEVCRDWEAAAQPAESLGLRVPIIRTGIVLGRDAGALGVMAPIFRWVPGGAAPIGNGGKLFAPATGRQWMSWIHLDDIVGILLMAIDHPEARGPLNGTSPHPVRNVEFGRELARVLGRPFLPIGPPDTMLKLILGERADVIVTGQRVLPERPLALGYKFRFSELSPALGDLYGRAGPSSGRREAVATSAGH